MLIEYLISIAYNTFRQLKLTLTLFELYQSHNTTWST